MEAYIEYMQTERDGLSKEEQTAKDNEYDAQFDSDFESLDLKMKAINKAALEIYTPKLKEHWQQMAKQGRVETTNIEPLMRWSPQ
jgi:hypothetical protein